MLFFLEQTTNFIIPPTLYLVVFATILHTCIIGIFYALVSIALAAVITAYLAICAQLILLIISIYLERIGKKIRSFTHW